METKGRHFILKHEKCGGVFTVNSELFLHYLDNREENSKMGRCPSCGEKTLKMDVLKNLLEAYCTQQGFLADGGYSIREIKEPIDPENLMAIVNVLKL